MNHIKIFTVIVVNFMPQVQNLYHEREAEMEERMRDVSRRARTPSVVSKVRIGADFKTHMLSQYASSVNKFVTSCWENQRENCDKLTFWTFLSDLTSALHW